MTEVPDNMLGLMYKNMADNTIDPNHVYTRTPWNYKEDKIVDDFFNYLKSTYGEHYTTGEKDLQCFDAWIAMGDATPTFRNTAIKYLWRYGKKGGNNKKDLLKAMHYILLCMYNDHYKDSK